MKTIKKHMIAVAIAGTSMLCASAAQAHSGWYVGLNIGQTGLTDIDSTSDETVGGVARSLDLDTDSEISYGIKLGYNVVGHESRGEDRFNVELYYQNSDHDIDGVDFQGVDQDDFTGSIDVETFLVRASYEIELGAIDPYFGIGIGVAELDVDARYGNGVEGDFPFATGSDSSTAIELRIGAQYSISKHFSLFLEYSYLTADDVTFNRLGPDPSNGIGTASFTEQTDDFSVDSINFGVNFKF